MWIVQKYRGKAHLTTGVVDHLYLAALKQDPDLVRRPLVVKCGHTMTLAAEPCDPSANLKCKRCLVKLYNQ